jgi:hypothetical protein
MPPRQKQKQSQNVRVTVNLAEKPKPRKKRGKYRRMKEPKEDVSRLAAAQAPRVQVIRYETPMPQQGSVAIEQSLQNLLGRLQEPHSIGAALSRNRNAFGTRDEGAIIPNSSTKEHTIDTPSELEGAKRAQFDIRIEDSGTNPLSSDTKKKRRSELQMATDAGYEGTDQEKIDKYRQYKKERNVGFVVRTGALGTATAEAVPVYGSPLRNDERLLQKQDEGLQQLRMTRK